MEFNSDQASPSTNQDLEYGELRMWLAFFMLKGFGVSVLNRISERIPIHQLLSSASDQLRHLNIPEALIHQIATFQSGRVDDLINLTDKLNIQVIPYSSDFYPQLLKQISSPPLVLFTKGDTALLNNYQLAIVGSRNASVTGKAVAREMAGQLCQAGATVTSGMALGIDAAAHQGALDAEGKTIAVLGTGVDTIYPKRHVKLAEQIIDSGLLISEFAPGTPPTAVNFPRRNRIISGLSLGTLVVEAAVKSGSLITANYAVEHNREVFAVPGSIRNPAASGCHALIKQGAKLVENVQDILEELSFFSNSGLYNKVEAEKPLKESEDKILANIGFEVTTVDEILERTQLPVESVLARLIDLEMEDKVERVLDGYIKLGNE